MSSLIVPSCSPSSSSPSLYLVLAGRSVVPVAEVPLFGHRSVWSLVIEPTRPLSHLHLQRPASRSKLQAGSIPSDPGRHYYSIQCHSNYCARLIYFPRNSPHSTLLAVLCCPASHRATLCSSLRYLYLTLRLLRMLLISPRILKYLHEIPFSVQLLRLLTFQGYTAPLFPEPTAP